ncbi:MAG TPA: hypothetical protein VNK41_00650 [Vicinamibacterales bacterium]|nr:hypothetical protein [Vicinamibacterales bacterium]
MTPALRFAATVVSLCAAAAADADPRKVKVVNRGGRARTFTPVQDFGPGIHPWMRAAIRVD